MERIVLTSNTSWSLYNFRFGLMKALKEKGFHVIAVALEDEYSQSIKEHFDFVALKNLDRKGKNPFKDLMLLKEYLSLYKTLKPDLVINYTIKPNIYSSIACGILGIKSISVITGLGYVYTRRNRLMLLVDTLYRIAFKFNQKIIFLNTDDLNVLVERRLLNKKKALLFHGEGINTEYFSPEFCKSIYNANNENFTFLIISRLLWDKGVGEYIESAKIIKKNYPQVRFLLLGPVDKGNPSAVPEERIKEWVREGIVEYLGTTSDVRPFICQADCIVLPSYREGLPRVLLEAMAMEKPIITTDAPGCREAVIDGINGFLVKPKDVEDLHKAMLGIMNLPLEKRIEMGKRGRQLVLERFDEKVIIEKYLEVIGGVLCDN